LVQCLSALKLNDLTDVQILVVDDASTDDTAEQAESFGRGAGFPIEMVRLPEQGGPAAARNAGLARAIHPYVLFLDADVLLPPESLKWVRESLEVYSHRSEVAGVLGAYSRDIPHQDFWSRYKNLYTCFLYDTTETLSPFIHTPIFCIRKDLLLEAGGFDSSFATAEDFRLGIVLGSAGYRFVIDRRIKGVHLKQYTFRGVLREDRRRIADLRRVTLNQDEQRFSYRAHRWGRLLSVALPGMILMLALACLWAPAFWKSVVLLLLIFYLVNWRFLRYSRRHLGWAFAVKSGVFLFFEMLWAEYAVARSLVIGKGDRTN
jgi:glycosyltransferase involved in cell wall biosynthesis